MADAAHRRIDRYLSELKDALRGIPSEEAREIVEEIRSHIQDSSVAEGETTEGTIERILERLGPPADLAGMYRIDQMARNALRGRSPWPALRTMVRWAGLSAKGLWVLLASVAGYSLGAAFLFCAVAKPFNPGRVGLWRTNGPGLVISLHLGFGVAPAGTELLGGWIVPLGLALGAGLCFLTYRFGRRSLNRFRRTLPMPGR